MASGCPLVASRGSSLDEVVGDAAVRVDPESVESIAQGLEEVLTDAGRAEELRSRGLVQARRFHWRAAGEATGSVYRQAIGLQRPSQPFQEIERPAECSALAWAILRTLCYADVFDSPMRLEEIGARCRAGAPARPRSKPR